MLVLKKLREGAILLPICTYDGNGLGHRPGDVKPDYVALRAPGIEDDIWNSVGDRGPHRPLIVRSWDRSVSRISKQSFCHMAHPYVMDFDLGMLKIGDLEPESFKRFEGLVHKQICTIGSDTQAKATNTAGNKDTKIELLIIALMSHCCVMCC